MKIEKLHCPEEVVGECVVVIDVLRAFTTTAFAFARGASKVIPVSTPEEAFSLKNYHPEYLLMGEIEGTPIPGFDFGNSPNEITKFDLKGRSLIQRTSAGTQGVVRSLKSKRILISSFVVAEATIARILSIKPSKVSFIITGRHNGDEDLALAEYLGAKILNKKWIDPQPFLQRVVCSPEGIIFSSPEYSQFPLSDLDAATSIDRFPFAMELMDKEPFPIVYPVDKEGKLLDPNQVFC